MARPCALEDRSNTGILPRIGPPEWVFGSRESRRARHFIRAGGELYCTNCGLMRSGTEDACAGCGALIPGVPLFPPSPSGGVSESEVFAVSWGGLQVILGIFLVVSVGLSAASLLGRVAGGTPPLAAALTSGALGLIILGVVWLLALRGRSAKFVRLRLAPLALPSPKSLWMTAGVTLASLGLSALYVLTMRWLGLESLLPPEHDDLVFRGPAVIVSGVFLALWTPLTEEILFRWFIFGGLIRRWGATGALFLSAAVFALFHDPAILILPFNPGLYASLGAPGVLIPIFAIALLFGWLYRATGSLWSCVTAHAVQNGLVVAGVAVGG